MIDAARIIAAQAAPALQLDEHGCIATQGEERYQFGWNDQYEGVLDVESDKLVVVIPNSDPDVAHLTDQLSVISAAILNGRLPATGRPPVNRYHLHYAMVGHIGPSENAPTLFLMDTERDNALLLMTLTSDEDDAVNFRAMRAMESLAAGLNAIGYDWPPATPEQRENFGRLPMPEWALPSEIREMQRTS